ncbi:MAG TPA: hypothetical protein VGR62_06615 [Candidatus Binatia bacterium]|nr:hypothetical protein [Candidatus Binatia bacterium]
MKARVAAGQLSKSCRRDALAHAKLSVCGRPGAAVCCRVGVTGSARHRVVPDPARCASTTRLSACVSAFQSVPTGCDLDGCIDPVCGNDVLEPGEACDPPNSVDCDTNCQPSSCPVPTSACGNGIIDGGEACEPPGAGDCDAECQTSSCTTPGPEEIGIACVDLAGDLAVPSVAASADASGYLVAWNGLFRRTANEAIARRFDADAMPVDPGVRILSDGQRCGTQYLAELSAGSDGSGHYVVWAHGAGTVSGSVPYAAIAGRRIDGSGVLRPADELAFGYVVGSCSSADRGPTAVTGAGLDAYVAFWTLASGCAGQNPEGTRLAFAGSGPPTLTPIHPGFPFTPPPGAASQSAASLASLGYDTLSVWHAIAVFESSPPYTEVPFVSFGWPNRIIAPPILSGRTRLQVDRPGVAAATSHFLVAWAQGTDDAAVTATEIRGVRVAPLGGRIDPDGGLLLATTGGGVTRGPVIAFDGTVWLVAWVEANGTARDLRGVAVRQDGTVVDATPRLFAAGISDATLAAASTADGRVLLVYTRADGAETAVRARLVPGT